MQFVDQVKNLFLKKVGINEQNGPVIDMWDWA